MILNEQCNGNVQLAIETLLSMSLNTLSKTSKQISSKNTFYIYINGDSFIDSVYEYEPYWNNVFNESNTEYKITITGEVM